MENHILKRRQEISQNISKSYNQDFLEKSGEGSRGGKVIGHDKKGKPIYFNAKADANKIQNTKVASDEKNKDTSIFDKKTEGKLFSKDGEELNYRVYKDGGVKIESLNSNENFNTKKEALEYIQKKGISQNSPQKKRK